MPNKKANHNHKENLGCVLGLLLRCSHKTSKLVWQDNTTFLMHSIHSNNQAINQSNQDNIKHESIHKQNLLIYKIKKRNDVWDAPR